MKILAYPRQARVRNTAVMQTNAKLQKFFKKATEKIICYFDTNDQNIMVKPAKVTFETEEI